MKPAATKLIVKRGKPREVSAGGVALPQNLPPMANVGLVLEIGSKVSKFDIDAPVVLFNAYQQSAAWDDLETRDGLVVIDEVAVLATFEREEAEQRFNVTFGEPVAAN